MHLVGAFLFFTVCSISFSVVDKIAESRTSGQIQAHAFEKLSGENHGFLNVLSRMIAAASDGWLPQTKQKFFSRRSVDLICHQLNADAKAPTIPERSWRTWFGERTERYREALATILAEQGSHLDASTVRAISEVERSTLLAFPPQWMRVHRIDQQEGWQRPPLLCFGVEDLFEDSFRKLAVLQEEVERGEQRHGLIKSEDWRAFPFPKDDSSV